MRGLTNEQVAKFVAERKPERYDSKGRVTSELAIFVIDPMDGAAGGMTTVVKKRGGKK